MMAPAMMLAMIRQSPIDRTQMVTSNSAGLLLEAVFRAAHRTTLLRPSIQLRQRAEWVSLLASSGSNDSWAIIHSPGWNSVHTSYTNRRNVLGSKAADTGAVKTATPRVWLRVIVLYLSIPLILLGCGGDIRWWQAWLYSLLIFASGVGGRIWAERRHPGLMAERTRSLSASDVKAWDKVLAPLMAISFSFPLVIVAGLDHRFEWSPRFPTWLHITGILLIALGYAFAAWALAENRFFSSMVRIQTDRGHVVCDSGPYRVVRHPGYAGNLLALPGIVLSLDSAWTLIPAGAALVIAVIRTALEDRTLQEELPGYREYARRVKYRLFPGVY